MIFLSTVLIICCIWYLLKFFAHFSCKIHDIVRKLSPYTLFLSKWLQSAPATFTYTVIFCAFTLVQGTTPQHLINILTNHASTSIARVSDRPISVFFDSAFWVADNGAGLIIYVAIFWTIIAWAERKYGSPRIIVITLSGHILTSIATIFIELWAINSGHAPSSLAKATDVGVSYIMVAGCAAAILLMKKWFFTISIIALGLFILLPVLFEHSIWDMGHLFATLIGFISASLLLKLSPIRRVSSPHELLENCRSELANL